MNLLYPFFPAGNTMQALAHAFPSFLSLLADPGASRCSPMWRGLPPPLGNCESQMTFSMPIISWLVDLNTPE